MAYNDERSARGGLIFDCECVALDDAGAYLEPVSAPSNYKDEAKIAAYCEQARREQVEKAALDIDLARIVALGMLDESAAGPQVLTIGSAEDEHSALTLFWKLVTATPRPTLIGFNVIGYDLPLLLRRSLYLGVKAPRLPINRYRHDGIEDLLLMLSFDGAQKFRSLGFYCRRFGIDVPDPHTGADLAALVACGDLGAVADHCAADIRKTAALAERLGVWQPARELAF